MPISHRFMPNNGIHLIPIFSSTLVITFHEANKVTDQWDLVTTQVMWSSSPPTDVKEETQLNRERKRKPTYGRIHWIQWWFRCNDVQTIIFTDFWLASISERKPNSNKGSFWWHLLQLSVLAVGSSVIYFLCSFLLFHLQLFYVVLIWGWTVPLRLF